MTQNNILEINNLSFGYHKKMSAVRNLSLTMESQRILCLLGPSGCGKTSLLRLIAGLETPDAGEIYLYGKPLSTQKQFVAPELREIGMLFQNYALFPHLTVAGNVGFSLHLQKKDKDKEIKKLLEMVDLQDYANHYPHMLSGGQQQRVALARAIGGCPKLLLLDEPFSGLDARLRDEVRDRTLHVLQESEIAAIMVTHDADEAMYMSDYITLMDDGRIIQAGPPEQLYYHPNSVFSAQFLSEVNLFSMDCKDSKVETPFGIFNAPVGQGRVDIVVRPEALKLTETKLSKLEKHNQMSVMASRLIGGDSMIHLYSPALADQDVHLHARISGRFLPREGEILEVDVDKEQLFVFACN